MDIHSIIEDKEDKEGGKEKRMVMMKISVIIVRHQGESDTIN